MQSRSTPEARVWVPGIRTPWGRVAAWPLLLGGALLSAAVQQLIDWRALAAVAVVLALAIASVRARHAGLRRAAKLGTVLLCFALGLSKLPGFVSIRSGPGSPPATC